MVISLFNVSRVKGLKNGQECSKSSLPVEERRGDEAGSGLVCKGSGPGGSNW